MTRWEARDRTILDESDRVPKVMGIVNITPDSFSDGGQTVSTAAAVERATRLVADGADLLDLGGESTRPGADPVPLDEELSRVLPVVGRLAGGTAVPLSIDTSKAEVARRALSLGASVVNDVTALRGDPGMPAVVADSGAGVVLMHMRGVPKTMHVNPQYDDVVGEVRAFLAERIAWCEARGIPRSRIAIDPGIGFGKLDKHSIELLRNLGQFTDLGCVVLVGISRKGVLGKLTGREVGQRMVASAVSSLASCVAGARVVRVHDVAAMADAIKVWTALKGWGEET
jgi:dihydropteroate synthase